MATRDTNPKTFHKVTPAPRPTKASSTAFLAALKRKAK